ncbi:Cilia- and flagella-associated protein 57 [Dissostichus eleginoides]|uniref:Cilia- and flagella-associated protein 57 n=1 Tax=Dissostichus eleginoides TaxID=100907 RepID=A0AAD9CHQ3_DISEL|nr:Cilia- and flagella-associated protein 57 [Dissostichus eleginoides]
MSSVVAQPLFSFGLRTGVRNSVSFCDENTVVFPCGNTCVCYNTSRRSQRFIPGSEKSQGMHALALSPNRRYLAVSECGERASITVFDLQHEQGRKRKVLTAGESSAEEFVCMAFSHDSKYLIGQTGGPDWTLILWLWEKQKVLATVKTSTSHNPVSQVSFNPHNNTQLCVSGGGVMKLFRYSEGALKQSSSPKVESIFFLCHSWVTEERVIAGTDSGRLLVFESGDLRREINTSGQETDRQVAMKKMKDSDVDEGVSVPRITAILSYSKGFICSFGAGTVCLFEKIQEDGYRRTRDIRIPADSSDLTPAESQLIDTMCLSPSEDTLVLSTDRGQLYSFSLSSLDINKEEPHFEFLSQSFHSKSITGLSVCIRKPLAATSSLDHSVRIWNYETKVLELYKEFPEEALSVALHPTGLFILVGFSDKLRLMNLLIDDIRTFKEFAVRGCRECAFSHGGHMFAAVNGNVIHIYSVTSFENILNLKGHNGKVRGIEWSLDDGRLVSCGMDGAVYEWNAQTGKRESESVLKSCSYTDVSFSSDGKTILAVGTDLTLKEIQDCQVLREVPADEVAHTAVAVSHSGRVVFTGTPRGTVRAMVLTWDDQFLLTAAEDGCLLMWKVVDKEGRGLKSNRQIIQTEEILVTKDMNYSEKMKEISDTFTQQIDSLKTMQQAMKTEMEKQQRENQMSTAEISEKHSEELEKLITEHERFQDLQRESERMQEDFEKQLKDVEEGRVHTVEELKQNYEAKLEEKDQCQEDAQQQIREFKEIRQIEERCSEIKHLKQERQRLLGLIRSLESDIEDLKRTVSGHEKTSQDKDKTICSLKKKNQELEKLKFVLDFQLNEMKNQTEPQQEDIAEKKERIHQLQEELVQIDKSNTQLKLSVSELRLKLRTRDKEMHKEAQKVKDLETHLQRLKADLHNCVGFIQEPKKLKDSMQTIYARYVADGVEQSGVEEEIQRAFCRQRDHLEKTVNGLKTRLAKSAEQHEQVYVKIMKENVGLITEINELRKELLLQRTQVKDYKSQLSVLKKSKRLRPNSEEGTKKGVSA